MDFNCSACNSFICSLSESGKIILLGKPGRQLYIQKGDSGKYYIECFECSACSEVVDEDLLAILDTCSAED